MKNQKIFDLLLPINSEQLKNLEKLEETCSEIQCAWISGYFWKIANKKSVFFQEKKEDFKDETITIVSASQTGNAKLLSKRLHEYLNKNNVKNRLFNAFDYKFKKIRDEKILIIIISTQGEGEVPEEALSLYKFLTSKNAPNLKNLYYSVFGLGDTSYDFFCQAGKDFDKRLKELGAHPLLNRFDADIEYEDDYNTWIKNLLLNINKIKKNFSSFEMSSDKNNNTIISPVSYDKKNPATGFILTNQKITGRSAVKDVHHIEIDIKNLNIRYTPGDAIGIWYKNDSTLIQKILNSLSIKDSNLINVKNKSITIFNALKKHFELTVNTKNIVKKYADLSKNEFLKNIISNETTLNEYVIQTPLVDMLQKYPAKISEQQLISFLRPLTPRFYSISSSQDEVDNEVHITVGVVKKTRSNEIYFGGASGYLSQSLHTDDKIKFFVENNNNFRLPIDKNISIIMIGTGTGIAPFRAFMQQRDNDGSKGKNWIFFGNMNFSEDFLYQIEWQQYIKKGILTKMNLAWSRDQERKLYIQHKIKENGKEIWDWIQNGAQIYVCGNAAKMAKDVEQALLEIIMKNNSMNTEDAEDFLNNLRLNRRYQRDVY